MLRPGTRLQDTYEVLALIATGGMGEVYRARDLRLRREVAVKLLRPEAMPNDESRKRFERETRGVAALSHPTIVAILTSAYTTAIPMR